MKHEENRPPAWKELMVGEKAPKLQTGKWIQGEPVPCLESNYVYVVEFWATWCGPCVQSIPHLNQLWQEFKDKGVIVVAVDVWDMDDGVAPFAKKMGADMTYRVALDDKSQDAEGFMSKNWWPKKVNHHGIPRALVINRDGVIVWIGHPMGLKEDILGKIVSGHYDLTKAATDYQKDFESNQKFQDLQSKLFSARHAKQWDDAEATLKEIDSLYPSMTERFATARLQSLLGQKKFVEAHDFADSLGKRHAKDAVWQNILAWTIATSDGPVEPCLGLAETMAQRAVEMTQGTNAASLDTLARVQFMLGKELKAVVTQEKAISVENDERRKADLEKTLASYRSNKLPDAAY